MITVLAVVLDQYFNLGLEWSYILTIIQDLAVIALIDRKK